MEWLNKNTFSGYLIVLFLFGALSGYSEGTKQLNTNNVQSTQLYICNDFASHCTSSAGLRSQFAAFDASQSAADVDRLYFVTINSNEVAYLGFQGGGLTNPSTPARHIVFRIKNLAGTIVLAEQNLPTTGTGYISTFTQALNGPNALILTPPYNGYDALVFTPPVPGTYYIEFSIRRDDNNAIYVGNCDIVLFDITVGNTVTHLAKPGRLYSKSWQFYESSDFYGKNYFISDDSIVTSAQFSGMSGGHWNQYCNQTGCGSTSANWLTNRKSLYQQQALFPQYKIFLNDPDAVLFPPATTLGQIVAPAPYGIQNCATGHILFHIAVNKPGNVELTLTFPSPYVTRIMNQAVVSGDNLFDWDGLDGTTPTGIQVPNGTSIQFTVQYINGLTNLPLYDVEGNASGFTIALVSPTGTTPAVFWDDTNIPGGTNNSTLPGCTSPPACHAWTANWGDLNTVNTWWYTVSTTTSPVTIVEFRGPQSLVFVQQPPQTYCANSGGHVFSVTPDVNTDVYHWSYTPPAGVTISQLSPGSYTVTVTFSAGAASGVLQVYGSNTNCGMVSATSSLAITINPNPVPTLTGSLSACAGSTGNVYTTAAGKSNYVWTISAGGNITSGGNSTSNTATVTWNTAGAQSISVSYTDPVTLCASATTTLNVTVNSRPVPVLTGNTLACTASTGNIYTTAAGKTNYVWAISSGGIITSGGNSTSNTATVTWNTAGAQTISVNYTDPVTLCAGATPTILNVTVNARPVPTLTGSNSVCAGSTGNVYTTSAGKTNYVWTISSGGIITSGGNSTSNTATVTWNTAGAQSISVNYTDPVTLCSALTPTTLNVTVNVRPVPTLTGTNVVCAGSTGIVYTTNPGKTNYVWTISPGGNITSGGTSTSNTATVTWNTSGSQFIAVNYTDPVTLCPAASPTTLNVTVNPLPVPSLNGSTLVCVGSTGVVYTTDMGATNYNWSISSGGMITLGGTSTSNTATVTWNTVGAQTISVSYTDPITLCVASLPSVLDVTVNNLPVPTFISGASSACQGVPGNVYSTETGMSNYVWTITGGAITLGGTSTDPTATVTWNNLGPQSISVNYTYPFTICTAPLPTTYAVTVKPLPVPSVISGNSSVCQGVPGNTYTTQPGMLSYQWSVTGGTITAGGDISSDFATVTWSTVGVQSISINYTDPLTNCMAASPALFPVTVKPLPVPSFISGENSVCLKIPGHVYTTQPGMNNYTWAITGGSITGGSGSFDNSATATWNAVGLQSISVSYTDPVTQCTAALPTPYTVTVKPLPVPTFLAGENTVCQGTTGTVYTTEPGMLNYAWTITGGSITGGGTSTSNSATATWTMTGSQSISVSYTDPVTLCTAASPTPYAVTVKTLPVPTITGPGAACLNTPGPQYSTEAGMSGYVWTVPQGTITPGPTPDIINVVWNTLGSHTMNVTYTGLNGCDPATPTQKTVMVNTLPVPTLSGQNEICSGIPATYTTESGMQGYVWTVPAGGSVISGGTASDSFVTISWIIPGSQNVGVNYALGTGCFASAPTVLAVTVTQSTPPVIQESPAGQNCATFSTTYSTQPGMTGYAWTISSGGSIISPVNTNVITVRWNTAGQQWVRVNFTNGYGCTAPAPTQYDVTVNPLPDATITTGSGPDCESIPHVYQVPADAACTFNWSISPVNLGLITTGQGSNSIIIDWQSYGTAVITVACTNNITGCFSSSTFTTTVNPRPNPTFTPCFDLVTTPNAKKFVLRGASPFLNGQGVFSGSRVSLNGATGNYEFDPYGASPGTYPVTYTYTNTFGCPATSPVVSITVQNNPFICGGILADVRDGNTYTTAMIGGKCWMSENLNFGTIIGRDLPSTDNCSDEKYCQPADVNCTSFGGLYQWDEMMRYGSTLANKGICPPEWHVPSETEWQLLLISIGTGNNPPDGITGSFLKDSYLTGGFHALLSGLLYLNNTWSFTSGNLTGTMYWTSTQNSTGHAVSRGVNLLNPSTSHYAGSKENAFSLRCVKD